MMMREKTLSEIRGRPPSLWSGGASSSCSVSSLVKLSSLLSLSVSVTSRPVTIPVRNQVIITALIPLDLSDICELYTWLYNSIWICFDVFPEPYMAPLSVSQLPALSPGHKCSHCPRLSVLGLSADLHPPASVTICHQTSSL